METTSPKEELPLKEVKKLHFLIHPGYKSDPAEDYREDLSESDERYTQWNQLLNSYVDKARELLTDEIMIVMLHASFKNLLNDFKHGKEYTGTLRSLKKFLGRRMIALSDVTLLKRKKVFTLPKILLIREDFIFQEMFILRHMENN